MSSDVVVYVIKESHLRDAIGSGNQRLINKINKHYADVFEEFREYGFEAPDGYSYEEAVRDLIGGTTPAGLPWHLTGYAIEATLDTLGEMLGNFPTEGASFDEHCNSLFDELSIPLDMTSLTCVGEINNLFPEPEEEPFWGCWKLETCKKGLAAMKNAVLSDQEESNQEILEDLADWMQTAIRRKAILVGMWV